MTSAPDLQQDDPFLWLENIYGDEALGWVQQQNETTAQTLAAEPKFAALEAKMLEILDSDDRIPEVKKHGDYYYNFWHDKTNERGIWRRTTLDSYQSQHPKWETVLDLDALSKAEGVLWVWHGSNMLGSEGRQAFITLSAGGTDADVTREFDLIDKRFIPADEGGFERGGEQCGAKGGMDWIDANSVIVYSDQGAGTTTRAGYPRFVQFWRRGTPLSQAEILFAGQPDDEYIFGYHIPTPGFERVIVQRNPTFFTSETYIVKDVGTPQQQLIKIEKPDSAEERFHNEWLLINLRDDWDLAGTCYRAGSLLAAPLDDYLAGARELTVLFEPTDATSLTDATWTRHHLVLNILEDVKSRLYVLTPPADSAQRNADWEKVLVENIDPITTVNIRAVDRDNSDDVWITTTGYLNPTTLALGTVTNAGIPTIKPLKALLTFFSANGLAVAQHFAISDDGTKIPYFIIGPKAIISASPNSTIKPAPTLLYGYGGFEIALTPGYSATVGQAWLEQGGVYVVANIRGGGEYGPEWHKAALQEKRHKAYEDFAAVARDLIARGITTPKLLAAQGGSNGGLLTGNMLAKHPDLFGAIIIQVPLLDMLRYPELLAGASWMSEYGDPNDPEQWEWLQNYSPYHQVAKGVEYPPVLIFTSTRDDRVHPGHARKMAAKLQDLGANVTYYENVEGGHGGSATNAQTAHMLALDWTFLTKHLTE